MTKKLKCKILNLVAHYTSHQVVWKLVYANRLHGIPRVFLVSLILIFKVCFTWYIPSAILTDFFQAPHISAIVTENDSTHWAL